MPPASRSIAALFLLPGATWPSGPATFLFTGYDAADNLGAQITAGSTVYVDRSAPAVTELDLPPVVKNDVAAPVTLTLHVTLDEEPFSGGAIAPPEFTYTLSLSGTDPTPVTSVDPGADDLHWIVTLTLPGTAGTEPEFLRLDLAATDSLGNTGGSFSGVDPIAEVYQGTLPNPPAPSGLTATSLPDGAVLVAWQAVEIATGYRVHRGTLADGSDLQVVGSTTGALELLDLPDNDGTYYYASNQSAPTSTPPSYSGPSPVIVSADSDRVPPAAPTDLALSLQAQGVLLSWTPVADAANYSVWRAASDITSVDALTAIQSEIVDVSAIDSAPTSTLPFYSVTAVDASGNESPPAVSERLNVDLLPVSQISFTQTGDAAPVVAWNALSGNIAGYRLAIGDDSGVQPVSLSTNSFTDSGYSGGAQQYTVTVIDDVAAESLPRTLSVSRCRLRLTDPETALRRGLLNRIAFTLTNNGDTEVAAAGVSTTLEDVDYHSPSLPIPPNASVTVDLVVPGVLSLPDGTFDLPVTLEIVPNAGERISRIRDVSLPVEPHALITEVRPDEFTFGGLGKAASSSPTPRTNPLRSSLPSMGAPTPRRTCAFASNRPAETCSAKRRSRSSAEKTSSCSPTDSPRSFASPRVKPTLLPSSLCRSRRAPPPKPSSSSKGTARGFTGSSKDEVELAVPFRTSKAVTLTETPYSATLETAVVSGLDVTLSGHAAWKTDDAPAGLPIGETSRASSRGRIRARDHDPTGRQLHMGLQPPCKHTGRCLHCLGQSPGPHRPARWCHLLNLRGSDRTEPRQDRFSAWLSPGHILHGHRGRRYHSQRPRTLVRPPPTNRVESFRPASRWSSKRRSQPSPVGNKPR